MCVIDVIQNVRNGTNDFEKNKWYQKNQCMEFNDGLLLKVYGYDDRRGEIPIIITQQHLIT